MDIKLASEQDLPEIKSFFDEVIADMQQKAITIWDDVYPYIAFPEDVAKKRLYLVREDDTLLSVFALCEWSDGQDKVEWEDNLAKPLYLYRFATNVKYLRKGIGQRVVKKALEISKNLGAEYLRLFVVDANTPAVELYKKMNFSLAKGMFHAEMGEALVLDEYNTVSDGGTAGFRSGKHGHADINRGGCASRGGRGSSSRRGWNSGG